MNRVAALFGLAGLVLTSLLAVAQQPAPTAGVVASLHFPRTAEDHFAVAGDYVKLATSHRKDADLHRRMLAAYERLARDLATQPAPPRKPGKTFPSEKGTKRSKDPLTEYRTHCETYIRGAEMLGNEADKLADFHRARARELRQTKDP